MEYEAREKAIRDYNQGMLEARESGWQEGEKAGIEKNQRDTARKMISMGLPTDIIAQATGLSITQIESLQNGEVP